MGFRLSGNSVLDVILALRRVWALVIVWCSMTLLLCGVCWFVVITWVMVFGGITISAWSVRGGGLLLFVALTIRCSALICRTGVIRSLRPLRKFVKLSGLSSDRMVWRTAPTFDRPLHVVETMSLRVVLSWLSWRLSVLTVWLWTLMIPVFSLVLCVVISVCTRLWLVRTRAGLVTSRVWAVLLSVVGVVALATC